MLKLARLQTEILTQTLRRGLSLSAKDRLQQILTRLLPPRTLQHAINPIPTLIAQPVAPIMRHFTVGIPPPSGTFISHSHPPRPLPLGFNPDILGTSLARFPSCIVLREDVPDAQRIVERQRRALAFVADVQALHLVEHGGHERGHPRRERRALVQERFSRRR